MGGKAKNSQMFLALNIGKVTSLPKGNPLKVLHVSRYQQSLGKLDDESQH